MSIYNITRLTNTISEGPTPSQDSKSCTHEQTNRKTKQKTKKTKPLVAEKRRGTHYVVNGVIGAGLAAVDERLGECGHDVLHQVVPQGNGLCLQQLILLLPHLRQASGLTNQRHSVGVRTLKPLIHTKQTMLCPALYLV